jgi:hypothetical protein
MNLHGYTTSLIKQKTVATFELNCRALIYICFMRKVRPWYIYQTKIQVAYLWNCLFRYDRIYPDSHCCNFAVEQAETRAKYGGEIKTATLYNRFKSFQNGPKGYTYVAWSATVLLCRLLLSFNFTSFFFFSPGQFWKTKPTYSSTVLPNQKYYI